MGQDPFGEIPLFKEIQRLLAGGSGPINLEIARQVAASTVESGGTADPELGKRFSEAVLEAEVLLSGYSRLALDERAQTTILSRAEWVTSTLEAWNWVFERLATRFTAVFDQGGEAAGTPEMAGGMLGQVVPLLMGLQVGTLVGHLAEDILSRFDLPIPRDDDGRLFLVANNADAVATAYGFDKGDLVKWLALQEACRRLILENSAWARSYFRSVVAELVDSVEIDLGDIERRMMEMQSQGAEAMQDLAGAGALPVVSTPRHEAALERYRAFVSLFEGYATHASLAVAKEWLEGAARIQEGMVRRAASPSEGQAALQNVLGLSFDRAMTSAGTTFCNAIVQMKGLAALNQVWAAPDNLPTPEEIRDPFAWIERVLDGPSDPELDDLSPPESS